MLVLKLLTEHELTTYDGKLFQKLIVLSKEVRSHIIFTLMLN